MRDSVVSTLRASLLAMAVVATSPLALFAQTPSPSAMADALRAQKQGDYATAARLMRPLAEQGDAEAQNHLGRMLMSGGNGLERDDAAALAWFRRAAAQGLARGQNNVAMMYERGAGVPQSDTDAATWYRRAADQGLAAAQYNLARLYEMGRGVRLDFAEAANWHAQAAEQGFARAQTSLGLLYLDGLGVTRNNAMALRWFKTAADQGLAEGQYYVGLMHGAGAGVAQNDDEAVSWYTKAAEQGLEEAKAKLAMDRVQRRDSDREDVRNGAAKREAARAGADHHQPPVTKPSAARQSGV